MQLLKSHCTYKELKPSTHGELQKAGVRLIAPIRN